MGLPALPSMTRSMTRGAAILVFIGVLTTAACGASNTTEALQEYAISSAWRHVHAGAKVYAGGGEPGNTAQPVCPTVQAFVALWHNGGSRRCISVRHGTPAIVLAVIRGTCADILGLHCFGAFVKLRATDRTWSGFSGLGYLEPNIPRGTTFLMMADWGSPLFLDRQPESDVGALDLGSQAIVATLQYKPRNANDQLFVRVLTGRYKDRTGWVSLFDDQPVPGQGLYGLLDPPPIQR